MLSPELAERIKDGDERAAYIRMADAPLPLLSTFYYKAQVVDGLSEEFKPPLPFTKNGYDRNDAIPARSFNLSVFKGRATEDLQAQPPYGGHKKEWDRDFFECTTAVRELNQMGVKAFVGTHKASVDGKLIDQLLMTVPRIALEKSSPLEEVSTVDAYESGVVFLAYLLHKNYVQAKDIPLVEGGTNTGESTQPFNQTMLKMAQSVTYQNKVRAGLGEALLPDREHERG